MSKLGFLADLLDGAEFEWKPFGEVGQFQRGKRFVKKDMISNGFPCIYYGELYTHYGIWAEHSKSFVSEEIAGSLEICK